MERSEMMESVKETGLAVGKEVLAETKDLAIIAIVTTGIIFAGKVGVQAAKSEMKRLSQRIFK